MPNEKSTSEDYFQQLCLYFVAVLQNENNFCLHNCNGAGHFSILQSHKITCDNTLFIHILNNHSSWRPHRHRNSRRRVDRKGENAICFSYKNRYKEIWRQRPLWKDSFQMSHPCTRIASRYCNYSLLVLLMSPKTSWSYVHPFPSFFLDSKLLKKWSTRHNMLAPWSAPSKQRRRYYPWRHHKLPLYHRPKLVKY